MNIYRILIMNCGTSQSYMVQACDAVTAIHNSGINPFDVIRLELIGSVNETDLTPNLS